MNPYIEEEQTTQWSNEKVQKDKQRLTKHTHIFGTHKPLLTQTGFDLQLLETYKINLNNIGILY